MKERTDCRATNDENDRLQPSQIKGLGMCFVALECDLRRKKVVNVLEHERQKCSTGILSTWRKGYKQGVTKWGSILYMRKLPVPTKKDRNVKIGGMT